MMKPLLRPNHNYPKFFECLNDAFCQFFKAKKLEFFIRIDTHLRILTLYISFEKMKRKNL